MHNLTFSLADPEAQLSASDRQVILCFWQGKVVAGSTAFVTNSHGERCTSLGFSPLYNYKGQVEEVSFATFMLIRKNNY